MAGSRIGIYCILDHQTATRVSPCWRARPKATKDCKRSGRLLFRQSLCDVNAEAGFAKDFSTP